MAELPTRFHDKNWIVYRKIGNSMLYRVLTEDNITGKNPEDGKLVSSKLKRTGGNFFEALFHGYSDIAIYDIDEASFNGHDPIATTVINVASKL